MNHNKDMDYVYLPDELDYRQDTSEQEQYESEKKMTYITVKQLLEELKAIPEELHDEEVRIMIDPEEPDSMLKAIEVRHKGQSGYEYHGEVLLVGEQQ